MCESKKSVLARQIQRMLPAASYKTAWYLCHRIRAAMKEVNPEPLKGTVEYDDTWHGGKRKGMGNGSLTSKIWACPRFRLVRDRRRRSVTA
jgi:hypothetical protein